jgi:hypothetical protein
MEKYILRKPFRKGFSVSGSAPIYFQKRKGDIVEGTLRTNQNDTTTFLAVPFIVQGRVANVNIPLGILKKYEGNGISENRSSFAGIVAEENSELNRENPTSKFTLKNILIGVVGIVVVYGILKATKIIK